MLDKYGELDKALAAYNWGPGNTDKWIAAGADPKKLPSETRSYIDKIKSTLGGERVADRSSKPAASPAPAPAQRPPAARGGPLAFPVQRTADLGTSYQAALALSFLADEAEREEGRREYDEREPSTAQKWLASATPKVSPEMLAMPYSSPFGPEPEPVRAADGGFIAVGYDTPSAYKDGGSVSDEEWKDGPPPPEVPRGLSGAIFGAATMEDAPRGPRTARERLMQMYHSARDFVEDVPRTPLGMATEGAMFLADRYKLMPPALQELMAQEKARRDSLRALRHARGYADGGEAKRRKIPDPSLANFSLWAETVSRDMYPARDDNVKRDAARHMLASAYLAHRTSPGFAEGMGKAYEFKEAPFKTLGHWMGVSAPRSDYSTDTRNNALGVSMAELARNPDALRNAVRASIERGEASLTPDEISSMGYNDTVYDPKKSEPVKKAKGGEVSDEPTAEELERASKAAFGIVPSSGKGRKAGRVTEALQSGQAQTEAAKGATLLPQNIVGAPVDIATLLMRPLGYNVEKPVMGSEWLKEKSRQAGVAFPEPTDPTLRAFYTAGDIGSNLVNPAGATRTAVKGAEKTGQAAKALAEMAAKDPTVARTVERVVERIAPAAAPMYAVKPMGGVFATRGSLDEEGISKFDQLLENYADEVGSVVPRSENPELHRTLQEFIDKKARKYFTTSYGTGADPLRQAISTGELKLTGRDVERIPPYLIAAAANPEFPGHLLAKQHLEKFYDQTVNLEPLTFSAPKKASEMMAEVRSKMTQEGLPAEYQNPPGITNFTLEDLEKYPYSTEAVRKMREAQAAGTLPSGQAYALEKGQLFYDVNPSSLEALSPTFVVENLAALPENKLKNMSFDQAMVEGAKIMQPRRDYTAAVDMAERGARVPKDVLFTFTKPITEAGNSQWVQLDDTLATLMEGKLMHHSVGGYHTSETYGHGGIQGFKSGRAQVFSLRDKKNGIPEVTLEAEKTDKGLDVSQIKGNFNSFPVHRANEIFALIDQRPDFWKIRAETYQRDAAGNLLPKPIYIDWQQAFNNWKAMDNGGYGEWVRVGDPLADAYSVEYTWGLPPAAKAAGGIVERRI
jgi:hypothetical protein